MRGHIENRGKKAWRIKIYLGEVDGKQKYLTRTIRGLKRDAQAVLNELLREIQGGQWVNPANVTFGEVMERWLDYDVADMRIKTRETYRGEADRHILPALGGIIIGRITSSMLEDYYHGKRLAGLSPATIRKHHYMIRSALDYAKRHRLIAHNVAMDAKPPKVPDPKPMAWTLEESLRFLEVSSGHRLKALWYLLLTTGGRVGELLALRWSDIDWQKKTLRFDETLIRAHKGPVFGPPKTEAGNRTLWLMEREIALLRHNRARQAEERLFFGQDYQDYNLVFATPHGTPLGIANVRATYRRFVEKAGNPWIRLHGLRHTAASLLLAAGVPPHVVAQRLGHASVNVTLRIYASVYRESSIEAGAVLDRLFGASVESGPFDAGFRPPKKFHSPVIPKTAEGRSG